MALTISIDTDNAAFDGERRNREIARILAIIADEFRDAPQHGYMANDPLILWDSNGNRTGIAEFSGDELGRLRCPDCSCTEIHVYAT